MKTKTIKVTLYSGRHEIPGNPDPIYKDFKFQKFKPIPADSPVEGFEDMVDYLLNQLDTQKSLYLYIYVTGLTPALTDFLSKALPRANVNEKHKIILLHYNRKMKEYQEQVITDVEFLKFVIMVNTDQPFGQQFEELRQKEIEILKSFIKSMRKDFVKSENKKKIVEKISYLTEGLVKAELVNNHIIKTISKEGSKKFSLFEGDELDSEQTVFNDLYDLCEYLTNKAFYDYSQMFLDNVEGF